MITIRPAVEADYPAIVAIVNDQVDPAMTLEQFTRAQQNRPESAVFQRLVAVLPDGRLAGFGAAGEDGESLPNHFFLMIRVDRACRGKGAGTALLQALADWARARGAIRLEATIREQEAETHQWAGRHGFVTSGRLFRSELKLDGWEAGPFLPAIAAAEAQGFRFASLAELGTGEENMKRFHQASQELEDQVPGRGPRTPAYEQWREKIAADPTWAPECILVALQGERWAGLTHMDKQADGSWYTHLTGVFAAYRGRGLGEALKVAAVRQAKEQGVPVLSTYNHTVNAPMVAINQKLGYTPVLGLIQVHMDLPWTA